MLSAMLRRVFLLLAHLVQRLSVGAFDTYKDREEIRFLHQLQQNFIIGEIERSLGRELERIVMLFEPGLQVG